MGEKSNLLIKKRALYLTFFITSIMVVIIILIINSIHDKNLDEIEARYEHALHNTMEFIIDEVQEEYLALAEMTIGTTNVKELIKEGKREELYALLESQWQLLTAKNPDLRIMLFHKADGTAFLRMHKPEVYDDYLNDLRPMVKAVHQQRKVLTGYETGKYSTVYRVLTPIFYQDEYLGSLDFGINPNYFVKKMYKAIAHTGVLFIKDENLKLFKRDSSFQHNGYTLQSSVDEDIFQMLGMLPQEYLLKDNLFISHNYGHYIIHSIDLKDYRDEIKAKLLFFHDVTTSVNNQKLFLLTILSLTIVFLITMFILLNSAFNKLLKELERVHNEHILENKKKDEIMIAQSRQAAMGDMLAIIAHQWRQPISRIAMDANNLKLDLELGSEIRTEDLENMIDSITNQTRYLSKTIDDFIDFFKPDKDKTLSTVGAVVDSTISIIGKSLKNNNITTNIENNSDTEILTHSNELIQVFLNIINNAQDVIKDRAVSDARITITIDEIEDSIITTICDNGGGIPEDSIKRIAEPYFSTKGKNDTGLGLYMSTTILSKHLNGSLRWENRGDGACFIVTLPKESDDE